MSEEGNEIPLGWVEADFEQCIDIPKGPFVKIPQKQYLLQGKYPIIDQGSEFIAGYTNSKQDLFNGNLPVIIFGDHTRIFKFIDFAFAIGADGTKTLKAKKGIAPKYIFYYLESLELPSRGYSRHYRYLRENKILLAPENEQKRIVVKIEDLLDRLSKTKEELSKIPDLLKKFRQAVLAKAFSGELSKEWLEKQKDLKPASKLLERIREERKKKLGKKYKEPAPIDTSDLSELPVMWEWTRIDDCCLVNPRHPSDILPSDTQISFIPMPAIDAEVGAVTKPEIRPLKKVIKGFTHFIEGDVLFAKITPCMENGKAAIAKNLVNGIGCGTTELHVLRPLGGLLPEFVYYYIRQQSFRDRAEANMTGTAGQLRVPVDFIRNEILPIPPVKEQRIIINKIRDLYAQADTIEKSVKIAQAHCEKLTQSILAKAFRGELVEQDPNDEPADKLLAKIAKKK